MNDLDILGWCMEIGGYGGFEVFIFFGVRKFCFFVFWGLGILLF